MAGPRFNTDISLGNILSILSVVFAAGGAYVSVDKRLETLEIRQQQYERTAEARESRIRQVETNAARADERVSLILQSLARIEARLERELER